MPVSALATFLPLLPAIACGCHVSYHSSTAGDGALGVGERECGGQSVISLNPTHSCVCSRCSLRTLRPFHRAAVVFVGAGAVGPNQVYTFTFLHSDGGDCIPPVSTDTGVVSQRFGRPGGYQASLRCSSGPSIDSTYDAAAQVEFIITGGRFTRLLLTVSRVLTIEMSHRHRATTTYCFRAPSRCRSFGGPRLLCVPGTQAAPTY